MRFTGIKCPVCGQIFSENDDVVVCPDCGTPEHRDCWQSCGGCANAYRHADGFIFELPDDFAASRAKNAGETITCPRCGNELPADTVSCPRCGLRLKTNTFAGIPAGSENTERPRYGYDNPNNSSPYQDPYAAAARDTFGDSCVCGDISVSDAAEFIRKNSNTYIRKFRKMEETGGRLSWNWAAFLFGPLWAFYRKMMSFALVLLFVLFAIDMISGEIVPFIFRTAAPEIFEEYLSYAEQLQVMMADPAKMAEQGLQVLQVLTGLYSNGVFVATLVIRLALTLLLFVVTGFIANDLYKRFMEKRIRTGIRIARNANAYHFYLQRVGGVSMLNVIVPVGFYMLMSLIMQTRF